MMVWWTFVSLCDDILILKSSLLYESSIRNPYAKIYITVGNKSLTMWSQTKSHEEAYVFLNTYDIYIPYVPVPNL